MAGGLCRREAATASTNTRLGRGESPCQANRVTICRPARGTASASKQVLTRRRDMRYAVVIERSPNNYAAYVPDLPGCVSTGATREEVERNIREAITFHLEGLREDGLP